MTREITLSRGLVALIDDADFDAVVAAGPWHAYPSGQTFYARHSITAQQQIVMHRLLTGWQLVDHANGDGLDNRRINLRPATHAQNIANSRRALPRSGYRGVAQVPSGNWRAAIGRRARYIGTYPTAEEAARAYDAAALDIYGEFARLNFPKDIAS